MVLSLLVLTGVSEIHLELTDSLCRSHSNLVVMPRSFLVLSQLVRTLFPVTINRFDAEKCGRFNVKRAGEALTLFLGLGGFEEKTQKSINLIPER